MKMERDIFSGLGQNNPQIQEIEIDGFKRSYEDRTDEALDDNNHPNPIDTPTEELVVGTASEELDEKLNCLEQSIAEIRIHLIKGDLKTITSKKKFKNFFHQVHFSHQSAHSLEESCLKEIIKNDTKDGSPSLVTVETGKFIFPLPKQEQNDMNSKIIEMGTSNGLLPLNFDVSAENLRDKTKDLNVICFKMK